MKQLLLNIKTALVAALLLVVVPPPANAYTAQQLIGNGRVGIELAYAGYQQATMHSFGNGVGVRIEASQYGTDWVKITNLFNGLVDLHFKVFEESDGTYLYLGNNAGLSSSYGIYGQMMASNSSKYAKVCVTPTNAMNTGDVTYTQINGKVTYDANKNSFQVDFSIPMKVRCFTSSSATALSTSQYTEYHNLYTVMFFQPTATISDTKVTGNGTSNTYEDRNYGAQFIFNGDDFVVTNWGGTGLGISSQQTTVAPGIKSTWYRMGGHYDAKERKIYMDGGAMYLQDNSEVYATSTTYLGNPYTYRMWAMYPDADNPDNYWNSDIEGDVTFEDLTVQHIGSDLWAAPHGGLKTSATMLASFEDWGVYNAARNDLGKKFGFRVKNTVARIPEFDITLQLALANFRLTPQTANQDKLPVKVEVAFMAMRHDMYVDSYDVYLVEGESPKGSNVQYMGNIGKNSHDDGIYSIENEIILTTPDGKPWSAHMGETFNFPYSVKIIANYSIPSGSPAGSMKLAAGGIDPSNHGFGDGSASFTVGVDGIEATGAVKVETTRNGVMVTAPTDRTVEVFNMAGMKVAQGVANTEISFSGNGVFMIKVGSEMFKIVK